MLGRGRRDRSTWTRTALSLAALACALPAGARTYETVPLAPLLPSPLPEDARRLWLGARVQRDWERFEMTLSDGTRYARPRPSDRFAVEAGVRVGPRVSLSGELTSVGLGSAVQVDLVETARAKVAAVLAADLRILGAGVGGAAGIAASAAGSVLGVRAVPFARVDAEMGRVLLDRAEGGEGTPYNAASRRETAVVSTAGVAFAVRSLELAIAGGWRSIVAAGGFRELRPSDPLRGEGAYAIASARWVFSLEGRG